MDPVIEEMSRVRLPIERREVWLRWVGYLRGDVQAKLDRVAALEQENAALKADLEQMTATTGARKAAKTA